MVINSTKACAQNAEKITRQWTEASDDSDQSPKKKKKIPMPVPQQSNVEDNLDAFTQSMIMGTNIEVEQDFNEETSQVAEIHINTDDSSDSTIVARNDEAQKGTLVSEFDYTPEQMADNGVFPSFSEENLELSDGADKPNVSGRTSPTSPSSTLSSRPSPAVESQHTVPVLSDVESATAVDYELDVSGRTSPATSSSGTMSSPSLSAGKTPASVLAHKSASRETLKSAKSYSMTSRAYRASNILLTASSPAMKSPATVLSNKPEKMKTLQSAKGSNIKSLVTGSANKPMNTMTLQKGSGMTTESSESYGLQSSTTSSAKKSPHAASILAKEIKTAKYKEFQCDITSLGSIWYSFDFYCLPRSHHIQLRCWLISQPKFRLCKVQRVLV